MKMKHTILLVNILIVLLFIMMGCMQERDNPLDPDAENFSHRVSEPIFSPAGGSYDHNIDVTITCPTKDAIIYYTTNGDDPTTGAQRFNPGDTISVRGHGSQMTIRALAVRGRMLASNIAMTDYEINYDRVSSPEITILTPNVVPEYATTPEGFTTITVNEDIEVVISTSTEDAAIYYTLNGTIPSGLSFQYSEPISITGSSNELTTITIRAIALKDEMLDSNLRNHTYIIEDVEPPSLSSFSIVSNDPTNNPVVSLDIDATDNYGVTGWWINEDPTPPNPTSPFCSNPNDYNCWHENKPSTYTLLSSENEGRTIHAWTKDFANNVSNGQIVTLDFDDTIPTINYFVPTSEIIPDDSEICTNLDCDGITTDPEISFILYFYDKYAPLYYIINESSDLPTIGWEDAPATPDLPYPHTLSSGNGTKTVYAWIRDEAGNISSDSLTIILDNEEPVINRFEYNVTDKGKPTNESTILVVFAAIDTDSSITGWMINESSTVPAHNDPGWLAESPSDHELSSGTGEKSVFGWVKDAAGNIAGAGPFIVNYDEEAPAIETFELTSTNPTREQTLSFTLLDTDDSGITGWMISETDDIPDASSEGWLDERPANYTLSSGSGTKTVYAWAIDAAGNVSNTASLDLVYDITPPVIGNFILSGNSPVNNQTINFNLIADDVLSGVAGWMLNESGSALPVDDPEWTALTAPVGSANLIVSYTLDSTVIGTKTIYAWTKDEAGNISARETVSVVFDNEPPTVTITSFEPNPTDIYPIPVTITFSEPVNNFSVEDITVGNGTVGNLQTLDNMVYTAEITQSANDITVDIVAGVASDAAGNPNEAADQFAITYQGEELTVSVSTTEPNPTSTSPIPVTITFNLAVINFEEGGITVGNGDAGELVTSDNTVFYTNIDPDNNGIVTVDIPAGVVQAVDNVTYNSESVRFSINFDDIKPSVSIETDGPNPTNDTIPVTISFSEEVTGLELIDIAVTNGTASNLQSSDNTSYTATIDPSADGTVTISIPEDIADDTAGNSNTASNTRSIVSDRSSPQPVITATESSPTNSNTIHVQINFGEAVGAFNSNDLIVMNAIKGELNTIDNITYNIEISPVTDGAVNLNIDSGVTVDSAWNSNTSAAFTIVSDRTGPSVAITSAVQSPANNDTFPVTITFDETVSGFTIDDITLSNGGSGTITEITPNRVYTADIAPITDGDVTVHIAAGAALDSAGNNNESSNQITIHSDKESPSVLISYEGNNPTNSYTFPVTMEFSEAVSGFTAGDLTLTNAGAGSIETTDNIRYTVNIFPGNDGTVSVQLAPDLVQDLAGNGNIESNEISITYDRISPDVSILSTEQSPTNSPQFEIEITFTEAVTGFDVNDIYTVNCTIDNFTTSDNEIFTADIHPSSDGTVIVRVNADTGFDEAGNGNNLSPQFSIDYDNTAPAVLITTGESDPSNSNAIPITVNFTEEVTDFELSDITISNGSADNLQTADNKNYSANIIPSADGTVTVEIAGNTAVDTAGNINSASNQLSILSDQTPPQPEITALESNPTNANPLHIQVDFGEMISGFTNSEMTVTNGTIVSFQTDNNRIYQIEIVPTANGNIEVNIAPGVATDTAGNGNASATFNIVSDMTGPAVTVTSSSPNPAMSSSIPVTITFDETVSGFTVDDITVVNGTAANFVEITENMTYTANIAPLADGNVMISVASGVALDFAQNANSASNQINIVSDRTSPQPVITATENSPTNSTEIHIQMDFGETVSDFDSDDITVSNGNMANFQTTDNSLYTVEINPVTDGDITVNIAPDTATDAAGNSNTSASFSITCDHTAPGVTITSVSTNPTGSASIPVTITFDETISGFTVTDINTTNGTAGNFAETMPGRIYTADIVPLADGNVIINVASGVAIDLAQNNNSASNQVSIVSDRTSPQPVITATENSPTNAATVHIQIDFGETVSDFDSDDISVSNGTMANFQSAGNSLYTIEITPAADGNIVITIANDVATDASGNSNTSTAFTIISDTTAPDVTISSVAPNPANSVFIPVTIEFDETVTGFAIDDITVTNGIAANFVTITNRIYTADIAPLSDGTVEINIAPGVALDSAGINNSASNQLSIVSDRTSPQPVISAIENSPTNASPIHVQIDFGEEVIDFNSFEIIVSNGNTANFQSTGNRIYSIEIIPVADGDIAINIAPGAAVDTAGNNNSSAGFTIVSDRTAPAVTITSVSPNPTNSNSIPVTITFDETMSGFTIDDITVTNGTAGNFAELSAGIIFTADIAPVTDGNITVTISPGIATDLAGNNNASAGFTVVSDRTGPEITITTIRPDPTNSNSIPVTVTFDETVSGFLVDHITVGNGIAGNFSVTTPGRIYTVDIVPLTDGPVSITIGTSVATDAAGNSNTPAAFSIVSDRNNPTVSITSISPNPTNSDSIPVTITFDETISGFTIDDISVGNGTTDNFTEISVNRIYTADITPVTDGLVAININPGVALDSAGNSNLASNIITISSDRTSPQPVITAIENSPTNANPIHIQIDFGEAVGGFNSTDIIVSNGSKQEFQTLDNMIYTLEIIPVSDGEITVNIGVDVAVDSALNSNTASNQFSFTYDGTPPDISITGANPATVVINTTYDDEGATTYDAIDGDLTGSLVINSTVDITLIGTYSVTYDVTDSAGNPAIQAVRTVNVTAASKSLKTYSPVPQNDIDLSDLSIDTNNWERIFDDTDNENSYDFAKSIAIDANDNIYVVGTANNSDCRIKKFNTAGEEDTVNWNKKYKGIGTASSIAIDSLGNVYIVGTGSNLIGESSGLDWWIKKFDSDGNEYMDWNITFDENGNDKEANGIAIDSLNNVYIVGGGTNLATETSEYDWWIEKFDSEGNEYPEWNKFFDGNGSDDEANGIVIDPSDNVYVVGAGSNLVDESSGYDWWIKKFDKNGNEDLSWNKIFDGNGSTDNSYSATIDNDGKVYIVGFGSNLVNESSGFDWWIKKFDNNGNEQILNWGDMTFDGNNGDDIAYSVVTDINGIVYLLGTGTNLENISSGKDWWIKKFDRNGIEDITNWNNTWFDGNGGNDEAYSSAIDSSGNMYIAGDGSNLVNQSSNADWRIIKMAP